MGVTEQDSRWLGLASLANQARLRLVFASFDTSNISPILIKGWAIERFYDEGHYRGSNDIDLLCPEDVEHIYEILTEFRSLVSIDTHLGPRHLDKRTFNQLFQESYIIDLSGIPIRVLRDEDNLQITCVHWLTDGGVNKDKLWDIYYLVKNRKADFDWVRCLESNGPIRKTWVLAAIATARDHLDLDVSGLPEEVQNFTLPTWYKQTIEKEWLLGIYTRYRLSTVITRPKLLFEQLNRKLPPNRIAATIDTETPIDDSSRIPAQVKSLVKKARSFARGLRGRITYSIRGTRQ